MQRRREGRRAGLADRAQAMSARVASQAGSPGSIWLLPLARLRASQLLACARGATTSAASRVAAAARCTAGMRRLPPGLSAGPAAGRVVAAADGQPAAPLRHRCLARRRDHAGTVELARRQRRHRKAASARRRPKTASPRRPGSCANTTRCRAAAWKRAAVKSAANCSACHTQADQGEFDERRRPHPPLRHPLDRPASARPSAGAGLGRAGARLPLADGAELRRRLPHGRERTLAPAARDAGLHDGGPGGLSPRCGAWWARGMRASPSFVRGPAASCATCGACCAASPSTMSATTRPARSPSSRCWG